MIDLLLILLFLFFCWRIITFLIGNHTIILQKLLNADIIAIFQKYLFSFFDGTYCDDLFTSISLIDTALRILAVVEKF
jgi:hypothetical protein